MKTNPNVGLEEIREHLEMVWLLLGIKQTGGDKLFVAINSSESVGAMKITETSPATEASHAQKRDHSIYISNKLVKTVALEA
ncbi:unnamed protein product [Ilex paraguariensis]|uniref:Uncharacterized protein n=1 Tax=Ilex paraguariensis TaxID=185542 RepID=A0ABC8TUX9_9AQUA